MSQSSGCQGLLGGPVATVFQRSWRFCLVIHPSQSFSLVATWMGKRMHREPHFLLITLDQKWHVISSIPISPDVTTWDAGKCLPACPGEKWCGRHSIASGTSRVCWPFLTLIGNLSVFPCNDLTFCLHSSRLCCLVYSAWWLLYLLGKIVLILVSMNEKYFIDRWGHGIVVLSGGLEDPPTPPFYRQEQLSPREGKSLVPLINGRTETNIAVTLPFRHHVPPLSLLICSLYSFPGLST